MVSKFGVIIMVRFFATTAVVTVGLVVGPAAFAQPANPNLPGGAPAATAAKDALNQHDKEFVKKAGTDGLAEVEFSRIAEKSTNPDVKRFADRIVQDHTRVNAELASLATRLGAEMPKALDAEQQRIRERLQTMHDSALDREYMRVMVEDHNAAVKLFHRQSSSGQNAELTQFAQRALPTLEDHQKMAVELSRRLSQTAAR